MNGTAILMIPIKWLTSFTPCLTLCCQQAWQLDVVLKMASQVVRPYVFVCVRRRSISGARFILGNRGCVCLKYDRGRGGSLATFLLCACMQCTCVCVRVCGNYLTSWPQLETEWLGESDNWMSQLWRFEHLGWRSEHNLSLTYIKGKMKNGQKGMTVFHFTLNISKLWVHREVCVVSWSFWTIKLSFSIMSIFVFTIKTIW